MAAAAGCSTTTPQAQEPTPADDGSYESPQDVADALESNGMRCDGYEALSSTVGPGKTGECEGVNDRILITVFDSSADLDLEVEMTAEMRDSQGWGMLYGANWLIVAVPEEVTDIQTRIGGEIV